MKIMTDEIVQINSSDFNSVNNGVITQDDVEDNEWELSYKVCFIILLK